MGNKKRRQKQQKQQRQQRDLQEEEYMRELDNIVMDVIEQVNNSLGLLEGQRYLTSQSTITNSRQVESRPDAINILDVYDSLLDTNQQIRKLLDDFQHQLASSKDTAGINKTMVKFTDHFFSFREWLQKQLDLYHQVDFSHGEEVAVGQQYVKECHGSKDVKECLHKLVRAHQRE